MKDQNTILDNETQDEKWNRGLDLYIESVHKPDHALRSCAHNQECFHELMEWRDEVIEYLQIRHQQEFGLDNYKPPNYPSRY